MNKYSNRSSALFCFRSLQNNNWLVSKISFAGNGCFGGLFEEVGGPIVWNIAREARLR
jgi:hypothetical protein